MTISERLFKLRATAPFNLLSDAELVIIAEAVVERHYEPGKHIVSKDKPARALIITTHGSLTDSDGHRLPEVLLLEELLTGTPLSYDVHSSPTEGAECLLINKGHFFTILYECPALATGFIEMSIPEENQNNKDKTAL